LLSGRHLSGPESTCGSQLEADNTTVKLAASSSSILGMMKESMSYSDLMLDEGNIQRCFSADGEQARVKYNK
jgi:hypothetical protein